VPSPTAAPGDIPTRGRNNDSACWLTWRQHSLAISPSAAARKTSRSCDQRPQSLIPKKLAAINKAEYERGFVGFF
jgi:hypothetical protein